MQRLLNIIGNVQSTCGDCHTTSCGTCGPTPKSEAPSVITRRDLGKSIPFRNTRNFELGFEIQYF